MRRPRLRHQSNLTESGFAMALSIHEAQLDAIPCYASQAIACGAAELSAQSRHVATVVTITGVVDATNVDRLLERSGRLVFPETGFVLDLGGVTTFAPEAARLVSQLDAACRAAGINWALVATSAVGDRLGAGDALYPFAASVPEALHRFADGIYTRRRLLLPFLTKSA
jgi:anti-anti-sigma regulatory factor